MKVHKTVLTVFFAPLVGVLLYLWSIGQFGIMADAPLSSLLGFVFICWVVAILITLLIGFPLGFGISFVLRRFHCESLLAYVIGALVLALLLAVLSGGTEMAAGFAVTAVLLAVGYWFGVAKPRVELDDA